METTAKDLRDILTLLEHTIRISSMIASNPEMESSDIEFFDEITRAINKWARENHLVI